MSHDAAPDASMGMAEPMREQGTTTAERARTWFDAAMDHDRPTEFLRQHAAEDPIAIERARQLIAATAEHGDLRPVVDVDDLLESERSPSRLLDDGQTIQTPAGPGVVQGILGDDRVRRMAEVYRVRLDGGGVCALKVLRGSSADLRARFRREAAALARLEHPGIARLQAAGVVHTSTGDRLPAIAMQLIEGPHLDEWAHARTSVEIASAVAFVARAVHYAHLRGVLHRDIKPANIVVDPAGRPMLLDLGVARLIEGGPDEDRVTLTGAGHALGTPQYMAPEQLTPTTRTVDLRCDVYALGVVLHELITGRPLVDVAGLSQAEALERKLASAPPPPRGLSVREQLLTVALCAASPDPDRRHESAQAFAEDIDRAFHGRPLLVRPPGRARRVLLFVRRNRVPIFFVLSLTLAIATIAGMRWSSQKEIRLARDRAEARFDETRTFANWVIFDLAESLWRVPGTSELRHDLVTRASATLDKLAADPIASDALLLELAGAYIRLSEIIAHEVGDFSGSSRPLHRAREMLDRLEQPYTPEASMLDAYLHLRWRRDVSGEDEVDKSAAATAPILRQMLALEPAASGDSRYWRWRAEVHGYYARRLKVNGATDKQVIATQRQALSDAQRAVQLDPDDPLAHGEVARAWYFLAYAIGESAVHSPAQFARAADDALPAAVHLRDAGYPRADQWVAKAMELIASSRARLGSWSEFSTWASRCIETADRAARTLADNILAVRNAEVCRIRLAASVRDAGPDVPKPILQAALVWAQDAQAMLEARRTRGWLGPVEDGRYDDFYAQVIENLRTRLAAQVPQPAQPDTRR